MHEYEKTYIFNYNMHEMWQIYLNDNWRQVEAWLMLFVGAVEVNYGESLSGRGSNTEPFDW